ncbi:MAG: hypothetical protein GY867_12495 [bacterium]|nr:hypothetical protein [bacterium]
MLPPDELEQLRRRLMEAYSLKIRSKRIRAIKLNSSYHWQPPMLIEVGKRCRNLEQDGPVEEVVAIFESTAFLVCTLEHGASEGMPHFFSRQDVRRVFEAE